MERQSPTGWFSCFRVGEGGSRFAVGVVGCCALFLYFFQVMWFRSLLVLGVLLVPSAVVGEDVGADGMALFPSRQVSAAPCGLPLVESRLQAPSKRAAAEMNRRLKEMGVEGMDVSAPDRWPTQIPVPQGTRLKEVSSRDGQSGFTYETNNYRFYSQVELDDAGQEAIGRLFECAYAANKAVGRVLPVPRAKGKRASKDKLEVYLYKNMAEYYAHGGPRGSAGVFMSLKRVMPEGSGAGRRITKADEKDIIHDDMVKVPFESLGINEQGRVVKSDLDSHALVHELTHQCFCLNGLPIWANEGWAEYIGFVPYQYEVLDFDKCFATVLLNAKHLQHTLVFPFSLEDFLRMSQEEMYGHMEGSNSNTYLLSVMCVCYFVHLSGRPGVKCMRDYMNALLKGESNERALRKLYGRLRTPERLQEAFVKAWGERGVTVRFASPQGED